MKKFFITLFITITAISALQARTNWRFYIGGMYDRTYVEYDKPMDAGIPDKRSAYNIWAGMDIQFIIKEKFYIETGLNYRRAPYAQTISDYYNGSGLRLDGGYNNWLSIPVRFGYSLRLNEKNSFEFGIGPYVSNAFERGEYDPLSVGISPVVTFKHRALSLSLHYENPIFYDGLKNELKGQFGFTIGINFNGRKPNWENIVTGLEAAGAILDAANQTMGQYYEASDSHSGESGQSYEPSKSKTKESSPDLPYDTREQRKYNSDKKSYEDYDSQLSMHFSGNRPMSGKDVTEIQKKMREMRLYWEKKGKSFPKSALESR